MFALANEWKVKKEILYTDEYETKKRQNRDSSCHDRPAIPDRRLLDRSRWLSQQKQPRCENATRRPESSSRSS